MIQKLLVPIPMRDGVCLSADIRLPSGTGSFPVVLVRTPYGNSGWSPADAAWLSAGYALVKQDCRGRYDSDGRFDPLWETNDGADTLDWIRRAPWCDGRIGMVGASYCGLAQLSAAWSKPVGLRAIAPAVMGLDLFKDLVYFNGVFNLKLAVAWGLEVAGRTGQGLQTTDLARVLEHLPLATIDEAAGCRLDHVRNWLAHPVYNSYWAQASVEQHYGDIDVPALHAGGWYDYYPEGTIRNFCGIQRAGGPHARNNQKLIMGPWPHGLGGRLIGDMDYGPDAVVDLDSLYRRWLERWVLDQPNGIDQEAPIRIFIMGSNVWRDEQEWPLARTRETPLFLGSRGSANGLAGNGCLRADSQTGAEASSYVYNPAQPVPTINGPTDHTAVERRDDVLVYTTEPLDADLEVTGFIRVILHVASDVVDTDFVARLCDVMPDGRSIMLCDGITRTRFREGLDREVFMEPERLYELEISLGATSNCFLAGHRVRLEITSSCFPRFARNLNTGEPAATGTAMRIAHQTIYHSKARPSRLILPVIPSQRFRK